VARPETTPRAAEAGTPGPLREILRRLMRWETGLVLIFIATLIFGSNASPAFMKSTNFFFVGLNTGEVAVMALPLALIIITGEIDLSVASVLGLAGVVMAELAGHGWPIAAAIVMALLVGALCGLFNGLLITRLGLPSLAVTIGTLALFRGIAQIILPNDTLAGLPASLTKIGVVPIPHTQIPYSIAIFGFLAILVAIALHATPLGRSIFAIGLNREAAFFSGVRVKRIQLWLFVLSGVLSALAGVLFESTIESRLRSAAVVAASQILWAVVLWWADRRAERDAHSEARLIAHAGAFYRSGSKALRVACPQVRRCEERVYFRGVFNTRKPNPNSSAATAARATLA